MLLKDHFKQQQLHELSTTEKFLMFEEIMQKTNKSKKKLINIRKFVLKSSMMLTVVSLFLVGLYKTYLNNAGQMQAGLLVRSPTHQQTFANAIAEVIYAKGHFTVTNKGETTTTKSIIDGGIVTLAKDSSLVIQIDNDITTTIVGPAMFSINYLTNKQALTKKDTDYKYRINMIQGDYISIQAKDGNDIELTTPDGLTVNEMYENTKKDTDFVMIMKDNNPVIVNKGTTRLSIMNSITDSHLEGEIVLSNIATIDTQHKQITIVPQPISPQPSTKIKSPTNQQDMIQTKSVSIGAGALGTSGVIGTTDQTLYKDITLLVESYEKEIPNEKIGELTTGGITIPSDKTSYDDDPNNNKEDDQDTFLLFSGESRNKIQNKNSQIILSDLQRNKVKQNTSVIFVQGDTENIIKYYLIGKDNALQIAYDNLIARYIRIYNILGQQIPGFTKNIEGMRSLTTQTLDILKTSGITDKETLSPLITLKNRLFVIQGIEKGQLKNLSTTDTNTLNFNEVIEQTAIDTSFSYLQR